MLANELRFRRSATDLRRSTFLIAKQGISRRKTLVRIMPQIWALSKTSISRLSNSWRPAVIPVATNDATDEVIVE